MRDRAAALATRALRLGMRDHKITERGLEALRSARAYSPRDMGNVGASEG